METKEIFLFLFGIMAMLIGFIYSYFTGASLGLEGIPYSIMVMGFFLAGTIFFGYFSFIMPLIFGMQIGAQKNAAIFLYIIPSIIAIYAGTRLGTALYKDYHKKKSFFEHGQEILIVAIIAIGMGIAVEIALPYVIQYWPQDFLGMSLTQENTALGMMGKLAGLIQN